MKNFALGITIGAVFGGANAFGSALKSTTMLNTKLQELKNKRIDLGAKFGKSSSEATKLNSKIIGLTRNIKLMNKSFALDQGLSDYRKKFKESFFDKLAIGTTIIAPIKIAIDFESAMADVKKVVNFSDELDFKDFEGKLLNLTKTIPLSASELAKISASGGQLGIAKENLLDFTTTVAKMSTAFDMDAETAGDSIAKLMNVFGLTQSQIVELGDSINHLSDTSASKAKDVVDTLGRIGGVTKVFGLTTIQAGALSSAFLALGKPPEVAATSINALLLKLQTAEQQSPKFGKALKSIGMSARQLKSDIDDDAQGALLNFLKTLEKVPKENQMGILSDLFGTEYSDDIALLVGGLDNYTKALDNVADKTDYLGSMNREFETRSKTTANNIKLLGNTVTKIVINFGTLLLPALNSVLTPIKVIGEMIGDFVTAFPNFSRVIGVAVVGAIGLSLGLSALGFMGSFALTGLLSLGRGLLVLNSIFLTNPIGLAIAAIAVGVGLIYMYWEPISGFFKKLWNGIGGIFTSAWTGIKQISSTLSQTISASLVALWSPISGFFTGLWNGVAITFVSTWDIIKSSFNGVVEYLKKPFEDFFNWIGEKFAWISDVIGSTLGVIADIGSGIGSGIEKVGSGIGDGLKYASNLFKFSDESKDGNNEDSKKLNPIGDIIPKSELALVQPNLNYSQLPKDEKKVNTKKDVQQTNHITVTVNNPSSTVDVENGIKKGLLTSTNSLNDEAL